MNESAARPPEARRLTVLRRAWGPFESEWSLFADRLEICSSSPTGRSMTTLDLVQIDSVGTYQEAPRRFVWVAGLLLAVMAWRLVGGGGPGTWALFFAVAVLAGFLLRGGDLLRVGWLQVETVGGRRFRLLGVPARGVDVAHFLALLRQARTQALADLRAGWQLEDGGFLEDLAEGDAAPGDEGPIDPRWIN